MGRFEKDMEKIAQKTDAEIASEISKLTTLSDVKVNDLFPQRPDRDKLYRLLTIVKDATDENEQINTLRGNIEDLAGTAIKLLKYFL